MHQIITAIQNALLPDLRPGYVREFHEIVRQAILDGKLTETEIAGLEKKREEMGLSPDILSAIKQELYIEAFNHIKDDEEVTDDEWSELEQIQDYLGLKDSDIAHTKRELYKLRILSEIRTGNMPVKDVPDLLLKKDEIAHWREPVNLLLPSSRKKSDFHGITLRLPLGLHYRLGVETSVNVSGWKKESSGELIITSKRIIFRGRNDTFAIPLYRIIDVQCYQNGIRIDENKQPRLFQYQTKGNQTVVGSIVLSAIDLALKRA